VCQFRRQSVRRKRPFPRVEESSMGCVFVSRAFRSSGVSDDDDDDEGWQNVGAIFQ